MRLITEDNMSQNSTLLNSNNMQKLLKDENMDWFAYIEKMEEKVSDKQYVQSKENNTPDSDNTVPYPPEYVINDNDAFERGYIPGQSYNGDQQEVKEKMDLPETIPPYDSPAYRVPTTDESNNNIQIVTNPLVNNESVINPVVENTQLQEPQPLTMNELQDSIKETNNASVLEPVELSEIDKALELEEDTSAKDDDNNSENKSLEDVDLSKSLKITKV